jgi:alkylation response protein AidB-like acyl-CoA dehydrogenase
VDPDRGRAVLVVAAQKRRRPRLRAQRRRRRVARYAGAGSRAEFVLTKRRSTGHLPAETARISTSFTIFEGTSEIQRMIIGRAVTGLDVR